MVRLADYGDRKPVRALRRPAPAGRAGALDRQPAAGAAARRAARRPRPEAARADAGRAQADPGRGRDHLRLRHPRPGGGADDVRPDRGLQRGPDRAGRHARARSTSSPRTASSPASSASRTCSSATAASSRSGPRRCGCSSRARPPTGCRPRAGRVRDVAYAGMITRYLVALDAGRRASSRPPEPRDVLGGGARAGRAGGGRRMAAGTHGRGRGRGEQERRTVMRSKGGNPARVALAG